MKMCGSDSFSDETNRICREQERAELESATAALRPGLLFLANRRLRRRARAEQAVQDTLAETMREIRAGKITSAGEVVACARRILERTAPRDTSSSRPAPAAPGQKVDAATKLLGHFEDRDREALERLYVERQSAEQICAELGLSEAHLGVICGRARAGVQGPRRKPVMSEFLRRMLRRA